jgi:O-methyltransferase
MKLPKLTPARIDQIRTFFNPIFWGTRDNRSFAITIRGLFEQVAPGAHFADNLFTWARNNSMLDDLAFGKSWESNAETETDKAIIWRRYILACAGFHCVQLDGDFVECGAYTGTGVKTVIDYLGGKDFPKTFWAYDLFEYNPEMGHHAMPLHGRDLFKKVQERFSDYPQVRLIKGNIPDIFATQTPDKICYLHIDLNEAPAEIAALESLFPRVVAGGVIVLDDYEWSFYRSQKLAEDPWFETRGYRVMPLPTGQGLVIKR